MHVWLLVNSYCELFGVYRTACEAWGAARDAGQVPRETWPKRPSEKWVIVKWEIA